MLAPSDDPSKNASHVSVGNAQCTDLQKRQISSSDRTISAEVWKYCITAAFGFLVLMVLVLNQDRPAFFDEPAHLAQMYSFQVAPSLTDWLVSNSTSAAGPLYPLLYHFLWGGVQETLPAFRLPNLLLLALVIVVIGATFQQAGVTAPFALALGSMALPPIWVCGGLAMTEMPAMAGIVTAIYATFRITSLREFGATGGLARLIWLGTLAAGVAVATCGRQTYLAVVPAIVLLGMRSPGNGKSIGAAIAIGLIPIGLVMLVWGGLTPPLLKDVNQGFAPIHVVYAICYTGGMSFWLAPRYFRQHWRWVVVASSITLVANLTWWKVRLTLFTSVWNLFDTPELAYAAEKILGGTLFALGAAWLAATTAELLHSPSRNFFAATVGVLAMCVACVAIKHQFSSRYVAMELPFLLLMHSAWMDYGRWGCFRLCIGMSAGALALVSYFQLAPS